MIVLSTGVLGGLGALFGDLLALEPAVSRRLCRALGAILFVIASNALYFFSLGGQDCSADTVAIELWAVHALASSIGVALGSSWVEPDRHDLTLVAGPMLGYLPFILVSLWCFVGLTII